MQMTESTEHSTAKAPGRFSRALLRLLTKRAAIVATERLTERFRLITLEGLGLQGADWKPGDKIQIAMGSAFMARTYTPMDWDAIAGRTRILGYAHGHGPGSAWIGGIEPGQPCDLVGPRRALDVSAATGPLAIFGDETSIGLGHAVQRQDRTRTVMCHFEVDSIDESRRVVARLGLDSVTLYPKSEDDTPIQAMDAALATLATTAATFALTGKATTIQRLRQSLKRHAVPPARVIAKAHWAPGKTGLD